MILHLNMFFFTHGVSKGQLSSDRLSCDFFSGVAMQHCRSVVVSKLSVLVLVRIKFWIV